MANLSEGQRGPLAPVPQLPTTSRPVSAVPPAPTTTNRKAKQRRLRDRAGRPLDALAERA